MDLFPTNLLNNVVVDLPAPKKINFFWNFGSLLGFYFFMQILSGLFLSMHYLPLSEFSFESMKLMTRDISGAWSLRFFHVMGSSGFFFFLILHLGRGLYYKSFKLWKTWILGVFILIFSMGTAFLGYVLPWGQMSYWGATVMTKFLSVIPYIGQQAVIWVWGGFSVDYPTLTRFFSLHFLFPFLILGLVILHMAFLHSTGSNNPLGLKSDGDKMPFFPYFVMKDSFGFFFSFLLLMKFFFLFPEFFSETENFLQAKPLVTPTHMQPEWYFLAAYAVLRAVPKKLGGVIALGFFIFMFFIFMFFDSTLFMNLKGSLIREFVWWLWVFKVFFLTWVGSQPVEDPYVLCCQFGGMVYFFFFFFWVVF